MICIFPSRTIHQLSKRVPQTLHGTLRRLIHCLLLLVQLLRSRLLQLLLDLHLQLFHHLRVLLRWALSWLVWWLLLLLGWPLQRFGSRSLLGSWLHRGDVPLGNILRVYFLCEMLGQDGGDFSWLAWGGLDRTVERERGAVFRELREGGRRRY